jgi:flagellar motor switch protein FliN/FliY
MDKKKMAAEKFAASFAEALAASIAVAVGQPWPLEVPAYSDSSAKHGVPLHYRLRLDGSLRGECYAEFYEPQISLLLEKMAQQPAEMTSEERADAFAKVVLAALPVLTESLSSPYGTVTVNMDRVSGLAFGGMFVVSLAAAADPSGAPVLLYFDTHLLESLVVGKGEDKEERQVNPNNLKLVMDVELNVSLRFGRRQLALREVLDLSSGSVVELDRMVDEPVELLLDGKVIARGEAVIVDGNYGLRVTEIPQHVASHFLN